MQALHLLVEEHKVIMHAISLLEKMHVQMKKGMLPSFDLVPLFVDFFQTYADKCHHGKEENILFQRLSNKKLSPSFQSLMNELIFEHKQGRSLVKILYETSQCLKKGEEKLLSDVSNIVKELIDFYTQHILKENEHFFLPALSYFSSQELEKMEQDFLAFDQNIIHQKYISILQSIEENYFHA